MAAMRVFICLLLCAFALASATSPSVDSATLVGQSIVFSGSNLNVDASKLGASAVGSAGIVHVTCVSFTVATDAITCHLNEVPANTALRATLTYDGSDVSGASFITVDSAQTSTAERNANVERAVAASFIDFEDSVSTPSSPIVNGYKGYNWDNIYVVNNGYSTAYTAYSGIKSAYNGYGSRGTIFAALGNTFQFSGKFRAVWHATLTMDVTVKLNNAVVGVYPVVLTSAYSAVVVPLVGDRYEIFCTACSSSAHIQFDDLGYTPPTTTTTSTTTTTTSTTTTTTTTTTPPPPPSFVGTYGPWQENTCYGVDVAHAVTGVPLGYSSNENSQCWFFSNAACSGEPITALPSAGAVTVHVKCTMTYYNVLTVGDAESNSFAVTGTTGSGVCGDPHVYGFDSRHFLFGGQIGQSYNMFANKDVVLNAQLVSANADGGANGEYTTVVGTVVVVTREYNFTIAADAFDRTSTMILTINKTPAPINVGDTNTLDCFTVSLRESAGRHHSHTLSITTPRFELWVYLSHDGDKFIDTSYLDFFFVADTTQNNLGGLLGATVGGTYNPAQLGNSNSYNTNKVVTNPDRHEYAVDPVCARARALSGVTCTNLPNGHQCAKNNQCASNVCQPDQHVCIPDGGCISNADCSGGDVCSMGVCK